MAGFVAVANVKDIKEGEGKTIEVNGKKIALFNAGGNLWLV